MQHRLWTPLWRTRLCRKALANKYNLPKSTMRNILNRAYENRGFRVSIITCTSRPDSMTHSESQFSIGRPWFSVKSVEQLVLASSGHFLSLCPRGRTASPPFSWAWFKMFRTVDSGRLYFLASAFLHSRVLHRGVQRRCCIGPPDSLLYNFASWPFSIDMVGKREKCLDIVFQGIYWNNRKQFEKLCSVNSLETALSYKRYCLLMCCLEIK